MEYMKPCRYCGWKNPYFNDSKGDYYSYIELNCSNPDCLVSLRCTEVPANVFYDNCAAYPKDIVDKIIKYWNM